MTRDQWKSIYFEKIPRLKVVDSIETKNQGRSYSVKVTDGGLDPKAVMRVDRLLKTARAEGDPTAFLGLLDALIVFAEIKPTVEELQSKTDAMIMFLLGMDVGGEEQADSFTFYNDPVR